MPNSTRTAITAEGILDAVERAYSQAAFVRELTVADDEVATWPWDGTPATRRIDALMLHQGKWTALEVKISRADFKRETDEKRRAWRKITDRFIYVTPVGLLSPDEIPPGCGFWEVDEHGRIAIRKNARRNKDRVEMPPSLMRTVIFRLGMLERRVRRAAQEVTP